MERASEDAWTVEGNKLSGWVQNVEDLKVVNLELRCVPEWTVLGSNQ